MNTLPEPIGKFDGFYYLIEYLSSLKIGLTVEELAREIGKSEKTVRRYLNSMEHSIFDIDVIKERGADRKYRYRIEKHAAPFRPILLNTYEIVALNFIRGFSHFKDFPVIQDNLNSIFDKISLSAKETRLRTGNNFHERVSKLFVLPLELGGKVYGKKEQFAHLKTLIKASLDQNICNFIYGAGEKNKNYRLAPLHFFNYRDVIYLIAKDLNDRANKFKNFALHRIKQIDVLENDYFTYPENFDIENHLRKNMFKFDDKKYEIKLKFNQKVREYILERQWFPNQQEVQLEEGSVLITFENEINLMLVGWIRSFGSDVEVLEPEQLRKEIIRDIEASYKQYIDTAN